MKTNEADNMIDKETLALTEDHSAPGQLVLPALVFSFFATMPQTVLVGLLLLDMSRSFNRPPSVIGQLLTAASLGAIITALAIGMLSVRFTYKSLLIAGLLSAIISALGSSFALNFTMIFIAYVFYGIGYAIFDPMAFALVGEQFPLEQRARAIGWLTTGLTLAVVISPLAIGITAGIGGWRGVFLGFVLPLLFLSLLLVMKGVPSATQRRQSSESPGSYWEGYREVLSHHSALVCLLSRALAIAGGMAFMLYGATLFRDRFGVSLGYTSLIFTISAGFATLGTQFSGRFLINRIGRKPLTVIIISFSGMFTIFGMNLSNLWLVLTVFWLAGFSAGIGGTAASSLALEQVPQFRGSMMALDVAAQEVGGALAAVIGGFTLFWWSFEGVGLSLGTISLVAALFYAFLVSDPATTEFQGSKS